MHYRTLNRITGAIALTGGLAALLALLNGAVWRPGKTMGYLFAAVLMLGGLSLLITGRRLFDPPDEPNS